MRSRSCGSLAVAAALASSVAGCSSDDSPEYAAYAGPPPYPDRRADFEPLGRRLGYVANLYSDTISVLDLDAMTLLGSVPVGRDPVEIDGPSSLVLDPAAGLAYVALPYPLAIVSAHAAAAGVTAKVGYVQALSLLDFSPQGELRVEAGAGELALSSDGRRLIVSHQDTTRALNIQLPIEERRANLVLVDRAPEIPSRAARSRSVPVCVVPGTVVYGRDDSRAFVVCTGEDSLAVLDTETGAVLSRVPAGQLNVNKPHALVRDPAGARLAVSNQVARSVVVFTTDDTPEQLAVASFAGVPFYAAFVSDTELLVATHDPDALVRVDATSGTILDQVGYSPAECRYPNGPEPTPDGRLYLVCEGDHFTPGAVVELDPATLAIRARVAVDLYPERLAVLEP